jgi:hypothetical protein
MLTRYFFFVLQWSYPWYANRQGRLSALAPSEQVTEGGLREHGKMGGQRWREGYCTESSALTQYHCEMSRWERCYLISYDTVSFSFQMGVQYPTG